MTEDQSLGVGLAVVARYVKNMKGQIRVQSELGKGTIFGIELPFEHANVAPEEPPFIPPLESIESSAILRAMSDTSNTPIVPSPCHEPGDDISQEEEMPIILLDTLFSPSLQENLSDLASLDDHSGEGSSGHDDTKSTYPFPSMDTTTTGHPRQSLSILIAEDNPINAKLLTRRLQRLGHNVEHVNNGQECHDYFALDPHKVDVVLMDIQVFGSGIAHAKSLAKHF